MKQKQQSKKTQPTITLRYEAGQHFRKPVDWDSYTNIMYEYTIDGVVYPFKLVKTLSPEGHRDEDYSLWNEPEHAYSYHSLPVYKLAIPWSLSLPTGVVNELLYELAYLNQILNYGPEKMFKFRQEGYPTMMNGAVLKMAGAKHVLNRVGKVKSTGRSITLYSRKELEGTDELLAHLVAYTHTKDGNPFWLHVDTTTLHELQWNTEQLVNMDLEDPGMIGLYGTNAILE